MSLPAPKIDAAKLDLAEPAEASLRAPALPEGTVHRTALVNRLRTERVPLVVLTAPAGYGKSTLPGLGKTAINAVGQLLFQHANPFWSLALFAVCMLIIYALTVYGGVRPDLE